MATELPILQCALGVEGVREQGARYAAVAAHVANLTRADHSLIAEVDAEVDAELLEELVATERACCAFFDIAWDGKQLSFAVADAAHAPALDVIEAALRR
jgi:hypothetical protein